MPRSLGNALWHHFGRMSSQVSTRSRYASARYLDVSIGVTKIPRPGSARVSDGTPTRVRKHSIDNLSETVQSSFQFDARKHVEWVSGSHVIGDSLLPDWIPRPTKWEAWNAGEYLPPPFMRRLRRYRRQRRSRCARGAERQQNVPWCHTQEGTEADDGLPSAASITDHVCGTQADLLSRRIHRCVSIALHILHAHDRSWSALVG